MQVKICPKCNARNRPASAACSNCYSTLEGVQVTEEQAPQVAVPAAPAAPRPPKAPAAPAQPTQQMAAPPQAPPGVPAQTQMGGPIPPPHGAQPMPPGAFQVAPQRRSPVGIIIAVVLGALVVFGAIGYALMNSPFVKGGPPPTESPEKVMLAFLEAKKTEDFAKCKPYLSSRSIEIVNNTLGSKQARSAGFTIKDSADWALFGISPTSREMAGKVITVKNKKDDKEADNTMAIVHVHVEAKAEPAPAPQPLTPPGVEPPPAAEESEEGKDFSDMLDFGPVDCEWVLVAEDGRWKVDIEETNRRGLGLGKKGNPFKLGK